MPSMEEIKPILSQLDGASTFFAKKEIKELPSILWENEMPEAIIQGRYQNSIGVLVCTNKRLIFINYGRTIFRPYFLQPLLFEDDLPYLEALLTNQEYKARYEYFYNLAGFDGDIIWQCIEAEYKGETTFFEYLHKQVINTPPRADATPKSLLSKIKSKFFN